jgi:hypothetical protein
MYEHLIARKIRLKRRLFSSDNGKIASLKLTLSPMYTLNRMGAKSEEMEKAKQ